jgi:hypothetical protein
MAEKKYPSLVSQKATHEVYSLEEKITLYMEGFFAFLGQHRKKHCIVRKQHTIRRILIVQYCRTYVLRSRTTGCRFVGNIVKTYLADVHMYKYKGQGQKIF